MNKHTATTPDGKTITRNSKTRTYTHAVVRKGGYLAHIEAAKADGHRKVDASNYRYYCQIASGNDPYPAKNYAGDAAGQAKADAENCKRKADAIGRTHGLTMEEYIAAEQKRRIARVEETRANGGFDVWYCLGWCGRPDLAVNLANSHRGSDYDVVILEATIA